ncbi:NLRC3 [Symbiodinium microadriaticum]|nr:NLRC3 [Symbiodinium microadriaticum]
MSGLNSVNQSTFEQSDVAMHEGGGVTAESGEPAQMLYTNLQDPSGLADLLLDERVDIRLVRGTCLKALDRKKQTFIRRQELENNPSYPDAFVTREELQKWKQDSVYRRKVRIIGVSHVWETREHPDPRGHQLALIAGAQLWHDRYSWYFLDYMSVYQFYRTSIHQNRSFQYTMMHMHFFYTHEYTWTYRIEELTPIEEADRQKQVQVFFTETGIPEDGKVEVRLFADLKENCTPYSRRGWCEAESQWSSMRSNSRQTVSLSFVSPETWTRAPMAPAVFQTKVSNSELLFTHQDSAEAVKELQERVFMEKAVENVMLEMSVLPPREFPILAGALPLYKNLQVLLISNSQVDCQGAEALSTVLTMSDLRLHNLRISADAVCKLALGLKGNSAVLKVALTKCLVDEEGAEGLADALACKDTRLESLDLSHNVAGCTGAKHLSDALIRNEHLRKLNLSFNSIADEGATSFVSLFESVALQELCLSRNCFGSKALTILQTGRNESLRRHGEVNLRVQCEDGPSLWILEDLVVAALLLDNLLFGVCHVSLPIIAFVEYDPWAGDYEPLQLWLTVPSILLVAVPPVLLLVAFIWEVCRKGTGKCFRFVATSLKLIWPRIWTCYSAVWLPAMQVYTLLERPPNDQQGSTFAAVIPYTLVLTALLMVQAVFVLFHPTFRAISRVVLRKFLKL